MDMNKKITSLENIYRNIDSYVMLVNEDAVILNANFYETEEIKKTGIAYRIGEILKCKNALEANGCGLHNNCKFCSLRNAVVRTFRNKKGFKKIESHIKFSIPEKSCEDIYSQVTTSYLEIEGIPKVVLTLNDITDFIKKYNISPKVDNCRNNVNPDFSLPPAFADLLAQEKNM